MSKVIKEYVIMELVDGKLVEPVGVFNRFSGFPLEDAQIQCAIFSKSNPDREFTLLTLYRGE